MKPKEKPKLDGKTIFDKYIKNDEPVFNDNMDHIEKDIEKVHILTFLAYYFAYNLIIHCIFLI